MSSSEQSPEPTMDEILASIRRIIADEPTVSSQSPAAPSDGHGEAPDDGVVNDIARALTRGGGDAVPNGGGEDIFELTNEVPDASPPPHEMPNAMGAGDAISSRPYDGQPVPINPTPERSAEGPAGRPFGPGPDPAPHPNMAPREGPFTHGGPPNPAPPGHEAPRPDAARDPAFRPSHPGPGHPTAPGGPPPPQTYADPNAYASLIAETGRVPPPGATPHSPLPGHGGYEPDRGRHPFEDGGDTRSNFGGAPEGGFGPANAERSFPQPSHPPSEVAQSGAPGDAPPERPMTPAPPPSGGNPMRAPQSDPGHPGAALGAPPLDAEMSAAPRHEMREAEPAIPRTETKTQARAGEACEDGKKVEAGERVSADRTLAEDATGPGARGTPENSFEKSVKEMLKPMLRDWLDDNMPRLLEGAMKDGMVSLTGKKDKG